MHGGRGAQKVTPAIFINEHTHPQAGGDRRCCPHHAAAGKISRRRDVAHRRQKSAAAEKSPPAPARAGVGAARFGGDKKLRPRHQSRRHAGLLPVRLGAEMRQNFRRVSRRRRPDDLQRRCARVV